MPLPFRKNLTNLMFKESEMSQLSTSTDSKIINLEVIVIGAGLSGIAAGIKLLKSGIKDF